MSKRNRPAPCRRVTVTVMLFFLMAFLLTALGSSSAEGYVCAGAVPCAILLITYLLPKLFPADRLLLALIGFLCAMSVLLCYLLDPVSAQRQAAVCGAGLLGAFLCACLVRRISWQRAPWLILPISILLLAVSLLFGRKTGDNGEAPNVFLSGVFSFQPAEIGKISLVIAASWLLARRKYLFFLLLSALFVALFLLCQDLSSALLYCGTALLLFWASTGNVPGTLAGLGVGLCAAWYGYRTFPALLQTQIRPDKAPGETVVMINQALPAVSEGGLWGTGIRVGSTLPGGGADSLFLILCQHFGLILGFCILLIYAILILRGASVASTARRNFHSLLAMGSVIMLGLQTFIHTCSALGLFPLAGVSLPFLSADIVSQIVSMCLAGFILGVHALREDYLSEDARIAMLDR